MLSFVSDDLNEMSIKELLLEENPDAILFERFQDCLIGLNRGSNLPVAVYDYWECVNVIMDGGVEYWVAIQELQEMTIFESENSPIFVQFSD